MTAQGLPGGSTDAAKEYLDRQEAIFAERKGELLAKYPDKYILVCEGEVFVGDSDGEAVSRAHAAHPGRPFFLRMHYPSTEDELDTDGDMDDAPDAAVEEDLDSQRKLFREREGELRGSHPGKYIAVCGGDVFVGDSDDGALSAAEAAHPDRPVFLSGPGVFCGGLR